ncbi:MAG: hypothetical protein FD149_635 [Rhodospirillaceae bacterium]|nr:MAG: hypothetical protein FD149_635 [Rhodospirillaceae bacterium]
MVLKTVLRGMLLIVILGAVGWFLNTTGVDRVFGTAWIDAEVKGNGLTGETLFVAVGALFTAFGLPRQVVCFLGGYAFGLVEGTGVALLASVGGCMGGFVYARFLGRAMVLARYPDRVRRIDAFLRRNPFTMTLVVRLLPVGSNLLTNLAAGISGIQARAFVAGSALGYVPQTIVFVLLGSGLQIDSAFRFGLGIVLFMISTLLGLWIFRRHGRPSP